MVAFNNGNINYLLIKCQKTSKINKTERIKNSKKRKWYYERMQFSHEEGMVKGCKQK